MKQPTLSGKTILITRAAHQAEDFIRLVKEAGGIPILFPTIEITVPSSWDSCDRVIECLYMYNGLIFTSGNGVDFFFQRMKEKNILNDSFLKKSIFVVGEKTKQAIEQQGLTVTLFPEKFTANDLSTALQHEDLKGKCFLFPRGNLGSDILADNLKILGAQVDSIIVYETHKPKQPNVGQLKSMILNNNIDFATFTSPSTFSNFCELFPKEELHQLFGHMKIAAIGPVTAKAIEKQGFESDVLSNQSTIESLIDSITSYIESHTQQSNVSHA